MKKIWLTPLVAAALLAVLRLSGAAPHLSWWWVASPLSLTLATIVIGLWGFSRFRM